MEKINIAELLKDCPPGMELDCALYECAELDCVTNDKKYPIKIIIKDDITGDIGISLTKEGYYNPLHNPKCVIFPKGKTTWEGFVPPCKFKEGDVVTTMNGIWIGIVKKPVNNAYETYITINGESLMYNNPIFCFERFATEEERQKLFQAIKDSGYKWNSETKTLEKLIEPKFKVGDKVRHKNNHGVVFTITNIEEDSYVCGAKAAFWFDDQDDYELVPDKFDITTLISFDSRVLVRDSEMGIWLPDFFGCFDNSNECPYMVVGGIRWKYCIPYDGNEHLLGKMDDCSGYYKTWE